MKDKNQFFEIKKIIKELKYLIKILKYNGIKNQVL